MKRSIYPISFSKVRSYLKAHGCTCVIETRTIEKWSVGKREVAFSVQYKIPKTKVKYNLEYLGLSFDSFNMIQENWRDNAGRI
jgi:hypothetical protein